MGKAFKKLGVTRKDIVTISSLELELELIMECLVESIFLKEQMLHLKDLNLIMLK